LLQTPRQSKYLAASHANSTLHLQLMHNERYLAMNPVSKLTQQAPPSSTSSSSSFALIKVHQSVAHMTTAQLLLTPSQMPLSRNRPMSLLLLVLQMQRQPSKHPRPANRLVSLMLSSHWT